MQIFPLFLSLSVCVRSTVREKPFEREEEARNSPQAIPIWRGALGAGWLRIDANGGGIKYVRECAQSAALLYIAGSVRRGGEFQPLLFPSLLLVKKSTFLCSELRDGA